MLKYLGLIMVIFSWCAGDYLLTKYRDKELKTISRHAASSKQASLLFRVILIGMGSTFYYWLMCWFKPHLELGLSFAILLTVTILCQFITAIVPDSGGWHKVVHHVAAYLMAALYLPLVAFIIASPSLSASIRIICSIAGLYMLVSFVLVAILRKAANQYLYYQAAYIVVFQSIILLAAYVPK